MLFFFIDLGAGLEMSSLADWLGEGLLLSLFVLIGNPLIVMIIMGVMGYRARTGFLAGLTVAQISEFSLVLGALGVALGHIDKQALGLITLVGLITISGSTYMILYSQRLYEWLAPWLGVFERRDASREAALDAAPTVSKEDILLFGLGRYGAGVARALRQDGRRVLGVDFDPETVRTHLRDAYPVRYGDAEDPEFLATLPLADIRWVVCTVRDPRANRMLLQALANSGYPGRIAVTAQTTEEADCLRRAGADLVLLPFADAAQEAVDRLRLADQDSDVTGRD